MAGQDMEFRKIYVMRVRGVADCEECKVRGGNLYICEWHSGYKQGRSEATERWVNILLGSWVLIAIVVWILWKRLYA